MRAITSEHTAEHYDEMETRLAAFVSERMLDLAKLGAGMRVLDVAAGRGEPALRAARRVGDHGSVLGVDTAEPRLEIARERALRDGLANVTFRVADAETVDLCGTGFDAATCRWGLMYVANPVRALSAIRRALRPAGLLVAALWAEPERVAWWSLPERVSRHYAELPAFEPEKSGPCRLGTLAQIERDFTAAGLLIEDVEEMDVPIVEAADGAGIVDWVRAVLTRFAAVVPVEKERAWAEELAAAAETFRRGGKITIGGVNRLVVARPT